MAFVRGLGASASYCVGVSELPPPPGPPSFPSSSGGEPPPRRTGVVVGLALVGILGYLVVNVIVGVVVLSLESTVAIGVGAGVLAVLGIGAGVVLLGLRRSWSVGLGLGLMIGWGLASIVSAGFCTGLNPEMYT